MACSDFSIEDADKGAVDSAIVEETFLQDANPRVDLLWMMDNTSSMETEQAHLIANIETFVDNLDGYNISWHIGVITPDGDGILEGNPWILTTETSSSETLAQTINVGLDGTLPQSGLAAITSALTEPLTSTANMGFRRDNAALHVVVYSDGDDQSDSLLGSDPVSTMIQLLQQEELRTGLPAVLSAVVGPTPGGCINANGGATAGARYIEVAERTGGSTRSICHPNLRRIAEDVTDVSVSLPTRFTLQGTPLLGTVRVAIDGDRMDDGWTVDGDAILFSPPPHYGATITVRYEVTS